MSHLRPLLISSTVRLTLLVLLLCTALAPFGVSARQDDRDPPLPHPAATPVVPPTTPPDTTPASAPAQQQNTIYLPYIAQAGLTRAIPPAAPAAPVVIQQSPAPGATLPPDGAIELVFDRPMTPQTVEQALQVYRVGEPAPDSTTTRQADDTPIAGQVLWSDERTVQFQPAEPLQREASYRVVLQNQASDTQMQPLEDPYRFRFATSGYLDVSQVLPADGTQDIDPESVMTVIFNRPMVPLSVIEEQANLPQPLTTTPAVAGTGEWLNTSIYVFRPTQPMAYDTSYTVSIDPTLTDVQGNPLRDIYSQEPYSWSFTTAIPAALEVVGVTPSDGETLVSATPEIHISFSQPVDATAAADAISLVAPDGSKVPATLEVEEERVTLIPSERLGFEVRYQLEIAAGLPSASDARPLPSAYQSAFTTVPLPRIVATAPADGDTGADPFGDFVISFTAPVEKESVLENLSMTPPLSPTRISSYTRHPHNGPPGAAFAFHLDFDAEPSTSYTVHIEPGISDPYGNTTGQRLDVSFTTGPLPPADPSVQLVTPVPVATYSAFYDTRVRLRSVNTSRASLRLYRLKPTELRPRYSWQNDLVPSDAVLVRDWQVPLDAPSDQEVFTRVSLAEDGGALEAGVYLLLLDRPAEQPQVQAHTLVVSPINLTLKASERDMLVWANNLDDGQPVADLALDIFDEEGDWLATATTDGDGVARARLERIWSEGVLVTAREPFAAAASYWNYGVGPWEFGLPSSYDLPEMQAHIYTDRPIYRPAQEVFFKGVLRLEDDVRFTLPVTLSTVEATIHSPAGDDVYQATLPLNEYGTFHGSFMLDENAALGTYNIQVVLQMPDLGERNFNATFDVAEYRPPEFEVAVAPQAAAVVRGTPVVATVGVDYFFGSPVASAPVEWQVNAAPYTFAPDWASRYTFRDTDDPWSCFSCWWTPQPPTNMLLDGSGTTDAQGELPITLPATLTDSNNEPVTRSVRLTIEAAVTGRDNQVVSSQDEVIVHRSDYYIGLANERYVSQAGEEQQIDLLLLNTEEERQASQPVDVAIYRFTWENTFVEDDDGYGFWDWQEQRTLVDQQTVTTDEQGEAVIRFTPAEGGSYRIVARTSDSGGREAQTSLFVWVSSSDYVSWRRDNNDRITLIADRQTYKPGETAEVLIPSPFQQPHWALITVERGGILSHEVRQVSSNSLVYRLPLEAQHAPNVFVAVVLFNPPAGSGEAGTRDAADYKVGMVGLEVQPEPQSLTIALTPAHEQREPGEPLGYEVLVTDHEGNPVAAELSLDMVDKAVLSLLPRPINAIKEAFYALRPLGVVTASGIAVSADRAEQREEDEAEGPVKGDEEDLLDADPLPDYAPSEPAPTPAPEAPDGGLDNAPVPVVREEFADTAFWGASITTGEDGRAEGSITLPDNLTTWVLRGVGITDATHVGEGTAEVVATRPLLIRPVTPRFLVVDDEVELAANVSNRTDEALQVEVGLQTEGLTVTDALTQSVTIAARSETKVTWQTTVQDVAAVDLVFRAVSEQYSDASKPRLASGPDGTLPVYRYSAPEVVGTGGQLLTAEARTEVVALPPRLDASQGELTVQLDPSLAAGMRDGLDYLEHFPHECTEQTVSRFLPNVLTARAMQQLGIRDSELEQRLPTLVNTGLQRLASQQNGDGGWGWWPQRESNPHVSAYVVFGLLRAREAGYEVRADMLTRGMDYLARVTGVTDDPTLPLPPDGDNPVGPEPIVVPDEPGTEPIAVPGEPVALRTSATSTGAAPAQHTFDANQQAWLLYVLAEGGRTDAALLNDLYERRAALSHYARAYLAMALHIANPADERIQTLLSDLNNAAIVSATGAHWEEQYRDYWSMNTDTRSTAIILAALVRLAPESELNPNIVRWLMVAREGGIWESTQETAWALMALTDWMVHTGELQASYEYGVWLNEQEQSVGMITPDAVTESIKLRIAVADLLQQTSNQLIIGRSAGSGRLYYTAHLKAYLPVEQISALERGVLVQRRYTLASCTDGPDCPEVSQVQVGAEVRVELSITAPNDLYYVVVEDPLPAGAEAIEAEPVFWNSGIWEGDFYPLYAWWWPWYSRSEFRDEKVVLYADSLHRGSYLYTYTMRATQPGTFHVIPTTANEFYFPEVYGRSDGQLFRITP